VKTSLTHLPEFKQVEINRIVEIIREVVNPEMIILFGSYAKGTYVEDRYIGTDGVSYEYVSDYDFLVVTKTDRQKTFAQESTIMDRVDRYKPPVNLEIHYIDYINEGLGWGQYFFADIVDEGVLLFNTGQVHFVAPRTLSPAEERQKAQDYFDLWFPKSQGFLKGVKFYLSEKELKIGAFNLHQSAESLYYAVLLVFTGYKPKTHNLWKLRKKTKTHSGELFNVFNTDADKYDEHLFDLLKRGYVEARYKENDYNISEEELAVLTQKVERMSAIALEICVKKIASYV
jgi:HEPN domain-containing protein/predicted nucleotidyltransferase